MNPVGSNSIASQIYSGVQGRNSLDPSRNSTRQSNTSGTTEFQLPSNATPKGDWVLSENASPQSFDPNAQRGSYLNIVV